MSVASNLDVARRIVSVMDLRFRIFGISFGIDPLLDIIPGLGNIIATVVSGYLFWIAYQLKVPGHVYLRMLWNLSIDYVLGVVPFVGIVMDVFFRANVKNLTLIEKYHDPSILEGELISSS
jgi:hypothetical protein